jgi:hypothetical protein
MNMMKAKFNSPASKLLNYQASIKLIYISQSVCTSMHVYTFMMWIRVKSLPLSGSEPRFPDHSARSRI